MIPAPEKRRRIKDISNVLIPELIPDQLQQLGITQFCGDGNEFGKLVSNAGQGINFINLLLKRSEDIAKRGGLYSDIETIEQPSQLSYARAALNLFMKQAKSLSIHYPVNDPKNTELYALIDRLTYLALCAGYFSGHNDALAITDRYTNLGYDKNVLKPQSGGKAKSNKTKPIKNLVITIAQYSFSHESLHKISKFVLAESIHVLLNEFATQNPNIAALQAFKDNCPEVSTIDNWLKPIKKQKIENTLHRPSKNKTLELLKKEFSNKVIKNSLK